MAMTTMRCHTPIPACESTNTAAAETAPKSAATDQINNCFLPSTDHDLTPYASPIVERSQNRRLLAAFNSLDKQSFDLSCPFLSGVGSGSLTVASPSLWYKPTMAALGQYDALDGDVTPPLLPPPIHEIVSPGGGNRSGDGLPLELTLKETYKACSKRAIGSAAQRKRSRSMDAEEAPLKKMRSMLKTAPAFTTTRSSGSAMPSLESLVRKSITRRTIRRDEATTTSAKTKSLVSSCPAMMTFCNTLSNHTVTPTTEDVLDFPQTCLVPKLSMASSFDCHLESL